MTNNSHDLVELEQSFRRAFNTWDEELATNVADCQWLIAQATFACDDLVAASESSSPITRRQLESQARIYLATVQRLVNDLTNEVGKR
jgi:hypothetical protein